MQARSIRLKKNITGLAKKDREGHLKREKLRPMQRNRDLHITRTPMICFSEQEDTRNSDNSETQIQLRQLTSLINNLANSQQELLNKEVSSRAKRIILRITPTSRFQRSHSPQPVRERSRERRLHFRHERSNQDIRRMPS